MRKLPAVDITLDRSEEGVRLYKSFTKRHPRYIIIRNKTVGVALVRLDDFEHAPAYVASVNGKNSAAYFSRKAARAGYSFVKIDPKEESESILAINTSASGRQGREMDESYKTKLVYPVNDHNLYYGIRKEGELVAYLWIIRSGELALVNRILGHADHLNNGVMYLMVTAYIEQLLKEKSETCFVMYDTFYGASDGLKMFKQRCGFKPYKVNWSK